MAGPGPIRPVPAPTSAPISLADALGNLGQSYLTDLGQRADAIGQDPGPQMIVQKPDGSLAFSASGTAADLKDPRLYMFGTADVAPIKAYHGSAHDFTAFDSSKIGTGEGAQVYGHGLYFAENPQVAEQYKRAGSSRAPGPKIDWNDPQNIATNWAVSLGDRQKALEYLQTLPKTQRGQPEIQKAMEILASDAPLTGQLPPAGHMYEVNLKIPPEATINYDATIGEQPPAVRDALWRGATKRMIEINDGMRARDLLHQMQTHYEQIWQRPPAEARKMAPEDVATALRRMGIKGIKYLDQGSRGITTPWRLRPAFDNPFGKPDGTWELANLNSGPSGNEKYASYAEAEAALNKKPGKTHNFVVLDDKTIEIARKFGLAGLIGGGAAAAATGQSQAAEGNTMAPKPNADPGDWVVPPDTAASAPAADPGDWVVPDQAGGETPTPQPTVPNAPRGYIRAPTGPGQDYGLADEFLKGLSLGTSDRVGSVMHALGQFMQGKSFDDAYNQHLAETRAAAAQFEGRNPDVTAPAGFNAPGQGRPFGYPGGQFTSAPGAATVARLAGALPWAALAPEGLGAQVATGAVLGGVQGAASAPDLANGWDVAARAGTGMVTGGAGALVGSVGGQAVNKVLPGPRAAAAAKGMGVDLASLPPDAMPAMDPRLGALLEGAAVKAGGHAATKIPGINAQLEGLHHATIDDIGKLLSGQDAFVLSQKIKGEARDIGKQYETQAYAHDPNQVITLPEDLAKNPEILDAAKIAQRQAAAERPPRKFDINAMTVKDADLLQRALDAKAKTAFKSQNAADNAMGASFARLHDDVQGIVKDASPEFRAISDKYHGKMSEDRALTAGEAALNPGTSVEQVAHEYSQLATGAEREAYLTGIATKVRSRMGAKLRTGNQGIALNVQDVFNKLEAVGVKGPEIQNIIDKYNGLVKIKTSLEGGSQTARRQNVEKSLQNPLEGIDPVDVLSAGLTHGAAVASPMARALGKNLGTRQSKEIIDALLALGPERLKALEAQGTIAPQILSVLGRTGALAGQSEINQ